MQQQVAEFSPQQIRHISSQVKQSLSTVAARPGLSMASIDVPCIACTIGLNTACAVPIGIAIAAGVVVAPEAAVVVAIVGALDALGITVAATAVATVLNTVIAAGGGASVEEAINSLCKTFGACS